MNTIKPSRPKITIFPTIIIAMLPALVPIILPIDVNAKNKPTWLIANAPTLMNDTVEENIEIKVSIIENELSTERMRYNDKVKVYNQDVKRFPKKIIAGMFGFSPKEYFQISEADKETPKVDFNK